MKDRVKCQKVDLKQFVKQARVESLPSNTGSSRYAHSKRENDPTMSVHSRLASIISVNSAYNKISRL